MRSTKGGYPSQWDPSKPASAFYAAYFAVLGVMLPFLGPFLQARGVAAVGIGLITAAVSLSKLFYAPLVAARVDRKGWAPGTLVAHLGVSFVAAAAVAFIRSPWLLGAAFLVTGAGYGAVLPLVEAAVIERLKQYAYGRLRLWGSVGFISLAVLAAWVVGAWGVKTFPWLFAGCIAFLLVTAIPFERHGGPPHPPRERGVIPVPVWGLLVLLTLHQVLHGPYYAFFSIHLQEHGYSAGWISGLWSLGVLAELVAFLAGGVLERRWGLRRLLGASLLLAPLRWALLALDPTLPVLIASQLGHAATFALAHLAGIQLVQRAAPASASRRAQAFYSGMTFGLGVVVGTALAGPAYSVLGGRGSFALVALIGVSLFVAWIPLAPWLAPAAQSPADTQGES